jgi:cell division protein FtsI (penicillin-binding protein 3)
MSGIEYTLEDELSPKIDDSARTSHGNQVILTIDIKLQYFMDRIALEAYEKNRADSVMILVMDAKNGEILAYSSIPRFDPNEFSKYSESERMNRPALMAYEPGSALKIFTISSMLESETVQPDSHFTCNGYFEKTLSDGREIKIRCMGVHGSVTPQLIIKYSCNAGAAYASEKMPALPFYEKLENFGFGQKTGILFAGESNGIFASPANWSARSKPTIAFGQEISVSAIQMVAAATVFANDGLLLKPLIVKRVISPDGRTIIKNYPREPVRRVLSPENAKQMLLMMETATGPSGSSNAARIDGIRVAAKTGTAQVADPQTGTYSNDKYIASIIGLFPVEDPQIIMYVVIQNPKEGSYWGSRVAAPVFKKAGEELIRYLDILKAGETIYAQPSQINIPKPDSIKIGSILPNLKRVPKRLLYPLFEAGLDVTINGEGYVVSQEPAPGTRIEKGMKITLQLE